VEENATLRVLISLGIAASALVLGLQMHAQIPTPRRSSSMQTAPGQFVSPLAVPGAVPTVPESGTAGISELRRGEAVRSHLVRTVRLWRSSARAKTRSLKPDGVTILLHRLNSFSLTTSTESQAIARAHSVIPQKEFATSAWCFRPTATPVRSRRRDDVVYATAKTLLAGCCLEIFSWA